MNSIMRCLSLGLLALLPTASLEAADDPQIWTARGGEARFELNVETLRLRGVEVLDRGLPVRGTLSTTLRIGAEDGSIVLDAPHGNFAGFVAGDLRIDTGWTLRHGDRNVVLDGLRLTPGIGENGHPILIARDAGGSPLLTFSYLHILAEHRRGLLTIANGDLGTTPELAARLAAPALADLPIGLAWFDLGLIVPAGADTSGWSGGGCADRPWWPQEGHPLDVSLIGIGQVSNNGVSGGLLKVTPSATLKNVGEADIPWIPKFDSLGGAHAYPYIPPDQHPFLVWNMYRVHDGRIQQLGASGVKHAFLTLNQNCTLNCGNGHVLWPGCEDVYSVGNNDGNSALGPRGEIEASIGLFESTCSFFDPGCVGSQTHNSGNFENRLMIDPADLQISGAAYYLDSWYLAQYDINIWNSMGFHKLTPQPSGGGSWSFNPLGPFTQGRALDIWVDPDDPDPLVDHVEVVAPSATPDDPYPFNMSQGQAVVAVRVSEPSAGHYLYRYAIQNYDIDRGIDEVRIGLPANAQVFSTWFGDVDDDSSNDWQAEVACGAVIFRAPAGVVQPWFTLYNFEIEVDTAPGAGDLTLGLANEAAVPSLEVAILGPEVPVVPMPELHFDPSSLDFGPVGVGSVSDPLAAELANSGEVTASDLDLTVPEGPFALAGNDCLSALAPGETCTVNFVFQPEAIGPAEADAHAGSNECATASLSLSGEGSDLVDFFAPTALAVDAAPVLSDGNGVFEPGELTDVAPEWRNDGSLTHELSGTASAWGGPAGASYSIVTNHAEYGPVDPGEEGSCATGGACYRLGINDPAVRPATHWTASFEEDLSEGSSHTWRVHIGDSFVDVARSNPFYLSVETLLARGVAGGCSADGFCPGATVLRQQMAIFLLRSLEGPDYVPPACVAGEELFSDMPATSPFCPWVEELNRRDVVAGCGAGTFCPGAGVNRAQTSVFLLRTLEGSDYEAPACSGIFTDVACPSAFANWIEEIYNRGLTSGCSTQPLAFCPGQTLQRNQMAAFLVGAFDLTIYGP